MLKQLVDPTSTSAIPFPVFSIVLISTQVCREVICQFCFVLTLMFTAAKLHVVILYKANISIALEVKNIPRVLPRQALGSEPLCGTSRLGAKSWGWLDAVIASAICATVCLLHRKVQASLAWEQNFVLQRVGHS